jgi:hypothetical protein
MRVELVDAPAGIHMAPVEIPSGQSAAVANVVADDGATLPSGAQVKLRGTGDLPRGVKVVSEVLLPVTSR